MGASGGFPVELILFGMIAAFLVLRLRSILGRRQGFERPPEPQAADRPDRGVVRCRLQREGRVIDAVPEPVSTRALPDPASPRRPDARADAADRARASTRRASSTAPRPRSA